MWWQIFSIVAIIGISAAVMYFFKNLSRQMISSIALILVIGVLLGSDIVGLALDSSDSTGVINNIILLMNIIIKKEMLVKFVFIIVISTLLSQFKSSIILGWGIAESLVVSVLTTVVYYGFEEVIKIYPESSNIITLILIGLLIFGPFQSRSSSLRFFCYKVWKQIIIVLIGTGVLLTILQLIR